MIRNLIGRLIHNIMPGHRTRDGGMILGPVSYLDCIVFCIFLAPQLIWNVGLIATIKCVLEALPFVCTSSSSPSLHITTVICRVVNNECETVFKLPTQFIDERWLMSYDQKSPFVRTASPFEDFVIRCVRYAFANIPPNIGRVFFSKQVALPFLRFRMLRHGYLRSPVHWREHVTVSAMLFCLRSCVDLGGLTREH